MDKYVAFIDILGFKEKVRNSTHEQASKIISEFSSLVYDEWGNIGNDFDTDISGLITSDCAIIYTKKCTPKILSKLLTFLVIIFQKSAFKCSFLLRAAIAKGEFDQLPSFSYQNLSKNLIVGQAYIDAYLIESFFKGSIIAFNKEISEDINGIENFPYKITEITQKSKKMIEQNQKYYNIQWAELSEFILEDNIKHFVSLAIEGKWLPHYYQTMFMFLKEADNEQRKTFFETIWKTIAKKDNSNKYYADLFIECGFNEDVEFNMKKHFSKFIRDKINENNVK